MSMMGLAGTPVTTAWFLRIVQRTDRAAKLPFAVHPQTLPCPNLDPTNRLDPADVITCSCDRFAFRLHDSDWNSRRWLFLGKDEIAQRNDHGSGANASRMFGPQMTLRCRRFSCPTRSSPLREGALLQPVDVEQALGKEPGAADLCESVKVAERGVPSGVAFRHPL